MADFELDQTAFSLGGQNSISYRDSCSGICVFGGTGSGKTSGSGKVIASSLLIPKLGGLVLTVKPEETSHWYHMAKSAGYADEDILLFSPNNSLSFDFLSYELTREGAGAGRTINLLNIFKVVGEMSQTEESSGGSSGEDAYWETAALELLRAAIDFLKIGAGFVDIETMAEVIASIPRDLAQANDVEWYKKSSIAKVDILAKKAVKDGRELTKSQKRDFDIARNYLLKEFPSLADRTRSSIENRARVMYSPFLTGELADLFSTGRVDIAPENAFVGKIIIVDMPVLEWGRLGRIAQGIWKYLFQKAVERRHVDNAPPVFIFADEAHYFVTENDQLFLTTARSARCITVFLTQNINNYKILLGEHKTNSILGNLQLKIFHQNSDVDTNNFAAQLIGKRWMKTKNVSTSYSATDGVSEGTSTSLSLGISESGSTSTSGQGNSQSVSSSASQTKSRSNSSTFSQSDTKGYSANIAYLREFLIQPEEFNLLKRGGPDYGNRVSAVIYQGGKLWQNNEMALLVEFEQ